jgi:dihydroorotate dehydrogenase
MWYQKILKPVLFKLDPELAHDMAYSAGRALSSSDAACNLISRLLKSSLTDQGVSHWGLHFRSPVGIAAGFDKNGHLARIFEALGFGFVEIGSITALASKGNPKPRMFRLPADQALVNRMGLNNDGARVIADRLLSMSRPSIPVGINIAKTHNPDILGLRAIEDYRFSFQQAVRVADYITVNISCPNTEEGKTFEDPASLQALLDTLMQESRSRNNRTIPVLMKLSADLDEAQRSELVALCERYNVDGYVAVNTSALRTHLLCTNASDVALTGKGGLSGAPLLERACTTVRHIKSLTHGKKPVIGVGGITSVEDALRMREAGADLIQIYTGLVYQGPSFPSKLARALTC